MDEYESRFRAAVRGTLAIEDDAFDMSTEFAALGADSLDLIELVRVLEEEFEVEVPDEELTGIATLGQAFDVVALKIRRD